MQWMTVLPTPTTVLELVKCNRSWASDGNDCQCLEDGLKCTLMGCKLNYATQIADPILIAGVRDDGNF